MKGSNIKRNLCRFTYSACALSFAMGLFVSCEDDLLTGTPSWLGSSIYEELQKRGNYQTTLSLISDPAINQQTVLSLTGSKTLFVANDEAYNRFFENNSWGVKSFAELSEAQKKLLFNSSMVNSAYLIELMSSLSSAGADPTAGACMRRATAQDIFDSIPLLHAGDMPDNPYWAEYREKYPDGGQDGMLVLRDNTSAWMVHFLPAFMSANSITDEDLSFLTNGTCDNTNESYINGQRLVEKDITCQNGYIQVLENVMEPLPNMAEAIRKDPDLSIFSSLLDRFSAPFEDESSTNRYNQYNTGETVPVYVWRYFNSGHDIGVNACTSTPDGVAVDNLLPYDPGWNQYYNATGGASTAEDMAVIIAPTNDAFRRFFEENGSGQLLMDLYDNSVDSIPDHIVVNMLDNFMKSSLVSTVPSKFETVTNTAGHSMGLSVGEPDGTTGIGSCIMANNGMVYKSNEVYMVPEYQSVAFPASLDDGMRIMRTIISELNYDAYLNSMESEFMLILPTDEALSHYVDPVDYQTNEPTVTRFYYNDDPNRKPGDNLIKCYRFRATKNPDGSLSYPDVMNENNAMPNPWDKYERGTSDATAEKDYVENRLKDVLENSIIVKDRAASAAAGRDVWVTKGGCPLILSGSEEGLRIITPYKKEVAENGGGAPEPLLVRAGGYYNMGTNPDGNGETFVVDMDVVTPSNKSVHTILTELSETDSRYSGFLELLNLSNLRVTTCDRKSSGAYKSIGNGYTLSVMQNYNYTVYVPTTDEIQKLYAENLLPRPEVVEEKREELDELLNNGGDEDYALQLEHEVDSLGELIDNFIRYHIQSRAVYLGGPSSSETYETTYLSGGRFSLLRVDNNSSYDGNALQFRGNLTIQGLDSSRNPVGEACQVLDGNYFAREYHFRAGLASLDVDNNLDNDPTISVIEDATRIYNSATAVVHLIDKHLPFEEIMGLTNTQN